LQLQLGKTKTLIFPSANNWQLPRGGQSWGNWPINAKISIGQTDEYLTSSPLSIFEL